MVKYLVILCGVGLVGCAPATCDSVAGVCEVGESTHTHIIYYNEKGEEVAREKRIGGMSPLQDGK